MTAKVIDENILSQVDSEGNHYQVLKEIRNHSVDGSALKRNDRFMRSHGGNLHAKKITRGWKLEVEWEDGTLSWIPLKDLKASNPVGLSEYVVANNTEDEPAFKWWVKDVICKRDQIISTVKEKYWITTHKFGIQVPKTVDKAYKIDPDCVHIYEKLFEGSTTDLDHWKDFYPDAADAHPRKKL